ncbi:MAG: 4Fe-4S binding protein [Spirochaetes bacterium]|nr:4Fe-4S binding protein [Spirochaetota bacterium]
MKRMIVEIDESLCNGCGLCIPNCAEGALKIVDGKARIVSDLFCDGLGACIGHCPLNAIRVVEREAEPYDEWRVMERVVKSGPSLIKEHLRHLSEHGQQEYLRQAKEFLTLFGYEVPPLEETKETQSRIEQPPLNHQWPVQLHLVNPASPTFKNADLLLAADCTAFVAEGFHRDFRIGRVLAVACPKLDSGQERYIEKIVQFVDQAMIRSITVLIMEVPCCGGLVRFVQEALSRTSRQIPLKVQVLSIDGSLIQEENL